MKITKKDKILLASLLAILVLGIFIMYGIVPAYQDLKAQEETLATLQAEVAKLKANYNRNNPSIYLNKIENSLMNYYLNENEIIVVEEDIDAYIDFDNKWRRFSLDNNLTDTGAIDSSKPNAVVKSVDLSYPTDDNKDNTVSTYEASVILGFEFGDIEGVYNLLEVMNEEKDFQFSNLNIEIESKDFSTVIKGTFTITKNYLRTPFVIPQPLVNDGETFNLKLSNDAPTRRADVGDTSTTLVFTKLDHAEYYEIYEVFKNEETGEIKYSLVKSNINADPNEDLVTYEFGGVLKEGHRYVVTAVGNYKQDAETVQKLYYRTIQSKYLYNKSFVL